MSAPGKYKMGAEVAVCLLMALALVGSVCLFLQRVVAGNQRLAVQAWMHPNVEHGVQPENLEGINAAINTVKHPLQASDAVYGIFTSELRVAAIGSAYPIPYDAEVCPYSDIPQPALNQLDRDSDGITDDWELKFGLDKYNAADALADQDGDGFNNREEFKGNTDPLNPASHPPYAEKLRFVERKLVSFPLVFEGVTHLPDGSTVFQLNSPDNGLTHFASLGESVQEVVLQRYEKNGSDGKSRLYVRRGSAEIALLRGETAADPESKAELINILDQSPIIVTMGALLSLHNDVYTVLGVYPDKVVLRDVSSGEAFDIISLAEGER